MRRRLALAAALVALLAASQTALAVRFAVEGDWGYGGPDQAAVARAMCKENARAAFAFVLTTGDNFYRPDGVATAGNFFRPERCLLRSRLPWHATWGNHDLGGAGTATALRSPRRYYSFRSGPLRVVVLDGNRPDDPAQVRFLEATLTRAREPARVVAVHQPVYTAGFHPPSADEQRLWVPLFRRYHVALVLQGHNHAYERMVVGGITYVTTGGGGAPVYPCLRRAPGLRACRPVHHFLTVNATPGRIVVRAVGTDGHTIDRTVVPLP